MDYTYATVAIADNDKQAAQTGFPEYFNCKCEDADKAIFWVTSGPFGNEELNRIVNDVTWPRRVIFGNDTQGALSQLGLTIAPADPVESIEPTVQEENV